MELIAAYGWRIKMNRVIKINNGRIISGNGIIKNGCVIIKNSRIDKVSKRDINIADADIKDAKGKYISPGFVDIHCHGGGGASFMDGDMKSFETALKLHSSHGTTTMYPTTVAADMDSIRNMLAAFCMAKSELYRLMNMPGIHIEGPYVAIEQKGALDPRYIKNPDADEYKGLIKSTDAIKRWTVAPELPGAFDMGDYLMLNGIMASYGHTSCTFDDVVIAMKHGYSHVTHLYSGMPQGVRRENAYRVGGMIEAAYYFDDITVELIADGCHLPHELLKLAYKIKGDDRIALVTDAMRGAGTTQGWSKIGDKNDGLDVIIEDGVAKLPDRSAFAGSVATADRLIRTMIKTADVPLISAVKMMTSTPAKIMGIDDMTGSIAKGKRADIVLFDDDINVSDVMVEGNWI